MLVRELAKEALVDGGYSAKNLRGPYTRESSEGELFEDSISQKEKVS
jgi:hypothetical protein